mmetsp:Transcript_53633/g.148748  ORF Transcript_53633/g.148748 Transcript_53633/m.148748 type:complete len:243 (+) Transcript_53633:695-1423(+)
MIKQLVGGDPLVENQAINLINNQDCLLQVFFVQCDISLREGGQAGTLDVISGTIHYHALSVREICRALTCIDAKRFEELRIGGKVALDQDLVVIDHVRSQAFQGYEGCEHSNDQRLALSGAYTGQHCLGELLVACPGMPSPTRSNSKHQQGDHLRVVWKHQDVVLLPHDLCSCASDLKNLLPVLLLKSDATPWNRLFKGDSLILDDGAYVHIRRDGACVGSSQWSCVHLPDALQKLHNLFMR